MSFSFFRKWLYAAKVAMCAAIRRIRVFFGVLYIHTGFSNAEADEGQVGGVRDGSDQLIKQPPTAIFNPVGCASTENDLSNQIDTVLKHNFDNVHIQQQEVREAFMPKMLEGRLWNDSFEEAMINYSKSKCYSKINNDPSSSSSESV